MAHPAAQRYADALIGLAQPAKTLPRLAQELGELVTLMERVPQAARLLSHPEIALEDKLSILRTATHARWLPLTYHALALLVTKGRVALVTEVAALVEEALKRAQGVERVQVRTARPLGLDVTARLQQQLARWRGTSVELACEVEPALLGGCQLRIGNQMVDGSLQTQLHRLREQLAHVRM